MAVVGDEERVLTLLPVRELELNPVSDESRLEMAPWRNTGSERTRWKLRSRSAIICCVQMSTSGPSSFVVSLEPNIYNNLSWNQEHTLLRMYPRGQHDVFTITSCDAIERKGQRSLRTSMTSSELLLITTKQQHKSWSIDAPTHRDLDV